MSNPAKNFMDSESYWPYKLAANLYDRYIIHDPVRQELVCRLCGGVVLDLEIANLNKSIMFTINDHYNQNHPKEMKKEMDWKSFEEGLVGDDED